MIKFHSLSMGRNVTVGWGPYIYHLIVAAGASPLLRTAKTDPGRALPSDRTIILPPPIRG